MHIYILDQNLPWMFCCVWLGMVQLQNNCVSAWYSSHLLQKQQEELDKEMAAMQLLGTGDGSPPNVEISPPSPASNL
jgi:hypothetical protein